jgi:pimeloyl-ACP methyl ester carboxylesterase
VRTICALSLLLCCTAAFAESRLSGDLPRRDGAPLEDIPGLDSHYGVLRTGDGAALRTILTRPAGSRGRLPAILFVQWLSCDTIELPASRTSGWSRMMRGVARDSGMVMMRTEKAGVGDSTGGPCSALDYRTELAHHREALAALLRSPHVDPKRVFVFGASMGSNMAPLVAAGTRVAGIVAWGGGAHTWFERTLGFERRAKQFGGMPGAQLDSYMKSLTRFLAGYLLEARTPEAIATAQPDLAGVWKAIVGTDSGTHYGRPLAFHQQAQAQDWAKAWSSVEAPVLVLYGEYDWFEDAPSHALIAELVNRRRPGSARFVLLPRTDHHFMRFADARAAFEEKAGVNNADAAVGEIVRWLVARRKP